MNGWLVTALALALALILAQTLWITGERSENSHLRAARERRERHLGTHEEMIATLSDLSEGTLSRIHAWDIALWIKNNYHDDSCAIAYGYNACTCAGVPHTQANR